MNIEEFINHISANPQSVMFEETMNVIEAFYQFEETAFKNGNVINKAGENSGSCKVLSFGQLHNLTEQQTLICFGQYYRDVLADADGDSHQNIRQFMQDGWKGVSFEQQSLKKS